jgi:hypothetical protein
MLPFLREMLRKVSNDDKASILGIVAGALVATKLDWGLLLKGDTAQMGTAAGAVIVAVIGFYTNRPDKRKPAEPLVQGRNIT